MNVNPIIIAGLASLGLPIEPDHYEGDSTDYITFVYADERPDVFADDTDTFDITSMQIHYFTKSDPEDNIKAIRRLLRVVGFAISNTQRFYEDDTGYNHIVVECWIDGEIED